MPLSERILVLAPLWRDGTIICQTLARTGFEAEPVADLLALGRQIGTGIGAGAIIITEEALIPPRQPLLQALATQPVWSDLPVTLLLAEGRDSPRVWGDLQELLPGANITVLTRPVPISTLVSVMDSALRARRRQYQVRAYLQEREDQALELERRVRQRTYALEKAGTELQAARDLFHALFHANPLPVAITRLSDGLFLDVNDAYLRYFGYQRQEVIGHTGRELEMWLPDPERDQVVHLLRENGSVRNYEMESAHQDGYTRTALVSSEVLTLNGTEAAISSFVDITERKRAEEQIRRLASQLTIAEREERHRISQILHDDLQQQLYSVQIQLTMLRSALTQPDMSHEVGEIEDALVTAIETTRTLSVDLSPAILRGEGLNEGIRWIAARMEEQYGLAVEVLPETDDSFPVADNGRRVLLLQIVRELLFNAVKHAGVSHVRVHLAHANGGYRIDVVDEGQGFDAEVLAGSEGTIAHGLNRSRERLRMLGGRLQIESTPGQGTHVMLFLPVAEHLTAAAANG